MKIFGILSLSFCLGQQIWDEAEIKEFVESAPLTCSSTIRLQNLGSNYFLHSLGVQYGSGSGQQIVRCHSSSEENGGLWTIKEEENDKDITC